MNSQIEQLTAKLNAMTALKNSLQDILEAIEKASGWQPKDEPHPEYIRRLKEERDEAYRKDEIKMREYNVLVQENRALSAKCAEMRQRICNAHDRLLRGDSDTEILALLRASWGEPSGNWKSPEEYAALEAKCAEWQRLYTAADASRDEFMERAAKAEAQRAEMRHALERIRFVNPMLEKPISEQMKENEALWFHALSSDCGKGWRSPEQFAEAIKPTRVALKKIMGSWSDADAPFESRIAEAELARLEKLIAFPAP